MYGYKESDKMEQIKSDTYEFLLNHKTLEESYERQSRKNKD
jgi:hypothetical protein